MVPHAPKTFAAATSLHRPFYMRRRVDGNATGRPVEGTQRLTTGEPLSTRASLLESEPVDSHPVNAAPRARVLAEVVALAWIVVVAAVFLLPALIGGMAIGPYDLLRSIGITATAHPVVHNAVGSDEIQEFIPWQVLSWLDVHSGHLPLWDPSNLLGMPLAFNFESAPFSLTIAIGYLFPLHLAHTVTIAVRLLLAGGGVYVLCRMLRLGILPAAIAATAFELSGGFTIWIGTYKSGGFCFVGWVLAASVALLRGERRAVPITLLALAIALAFAEAEPQVDSLVILPMVVLAGVVSSHRWRLGDRRLAARMLLDHGLAVLAAMALVAPIYLPSLQLLTASARTSGPYAVGLPPSQLTHLIFSGYDGVPTALGSIVGAMNPYISIVYVGVVVVVLACAGLAWIRTRPEAFAFALLAMFLVLALFAPPAAALLRHVPGLRVFGLVLVSPILDLSIAVLAAYGAQALKGRLTPQTVRESRIDDGRPADAVAASRPDKRATTDWSVVAGEAPGRVVRSARRLFLFGVGCLALVLVALEIRLRVGVDHLTALQASVRAGSFIWPALSIAACALLVASWGPLRRFVERGSRRMGTSLLLGVLLGTETAFLLTAGATYLSSTQRPFPQSPAIVSLQRAVGSGLIGFGACAENAFPDLGIMPQVNAVYGVSELVVYDPILPTTYYASYGALTGGPGKPLIPHVFCPEITSLRLARFYGVTDILEPPGVAGPPGTTRVAVIHGEGVYHVPASGRATLTPLHRSTRANSSIPTIVSAIEPAPGSWRVRFDAPTASRLVLRVTDVPGWHASVNGKPLALHPFHGVMLAADVPAGHDVVTLRYWPGTITVGLGVAAAAAAGLGLALAWAARNRRRRPNRPRCGKRASFVPTPQADMARSGLPASATASRPLRGSEGTAR